MDDSSSAPELVFGLVGPLGTDLKAVAAVLRDALVAVRYESEVHRLSHLMRELQGEPWDTLKDGYEDETLDAHMKAGNRLRQTLGRHDAMAMLGLMSIQELRQRKTGESTRPLGRFAHILHSLKRPEEVKTLRGIYGPALVVLAVYSPRPKRLDDLARRIAGSRHSNQFGDHRSTVRSIKFDVGPTQRWSTVTNSTEVEMKDEDEVPVRTVDDIVYIFIHTGTISYSEYQFAPVSLR